MTDQRSLDDLSGTHGGPKSETRFVVRGVKIPLGDTLRWLLEAVEAIGPARGGEVGKWVEARRGHKLPGNPRKRGWSQLRSRKMVTETDEGYEITDKGREILSADRWAKGES